MMSFREVFELINKSLLQHDIDLREHVVELWNRQQLPEHLGNGHWIHRLNRGRAVHNRDVRDHHIDDQGDQRKVTMDLINLDPASQMAWYAGDMQQRTPGLLKAGIALSHETTTYFEIEIVAYGEDGSIGIGLVPLDYPFGNQPGWRNRSIGYHADDGGIFVEHGSAFKLKEKCYVGDRMGCGIEMIDGRQFVYFTKNGHSVAEQPFDVGVDLFPAVGLNTAGARVKLMNSDVWDLLPGNGQNQDLTAPWNDELDDGIDVTVIEQTGHISVFWKYDGFRDVMIPATVAFSQDKAYFEIELFAFGENDDISIGLVPKDYPQRRHPGWLPNSVGLHVTRGQFFTGQTISRREQVEKFTAGDRIGCGVEYIGNTTQVYFSKNGRTFLEEELTLVNEVFPAVGLRSAGKTVSVCVQDFEDWDFKVKGSGRGVTHRSDSSCGSDCATSRQVTRAKPSLIECNLDNCTAQLEAVPGRTVTATRIGNKPFSNDLSLFEFEFLDGEAVVVGAVSQDYSVEELPGCHPKSIGYHSDDGGIYQECGRTSMFYDACSHGDRMGCGVITSDENQQIFFFTRNGETIAEVPFGNGHQRWFPAIGMKSEQISTRVFICDTSIWEDLPPSASLDYAPKAGETAHQRQETDQLEAFGQELNCPICWNILEKPKMFPCRQQHSYCLECLRNHVAGVTAGDVVHCPVCRVGARMPQNLDDLPDNRILNRLIEAYKKLRA